MTSFRSGHHAPHAMDARELAVEDRGLTVAAVAAEPRTIDHSDEEVVEPYLDVLGAGDIEHVAPVAGHHSLSEPDPEPNPPQPDPEPIPDNGDDDEGEEDDQEPDGEPEPEPVPPAGRRRR